MQRRTADGDAADFHRFEHGDRRERARAPHLKNDVVHYRGFLPRRIFVGDGPARRLRREAQFLLQRDFIHFDDDAVDFIRQLLALAFPRVDKLFHRVERMADAPIGRNLEVQLLQRFERFRMQAHRLAPAGQQIVRVKIELPRPRDLRIENAHRARRDIARIRVALPALLLLLFIQGFEGAQRHDDFSAHFKIRRQAQFLQLRGIHAQRDRADRAHIRGDVFAGRAVAARDAARRARRLRKSAKCSSRRICVR